MPDQSLIDTLAVYGAEYLYILLLATALGWYLRQPRTAQIEMIAWGVVALPAMYILLIVAGMVYFDPRPFVVGNFTSRIPHAPDNGFPSDHTLLCSATASIVFFYNKKFGGVLWLLTALVGASRVYTGLHHPLDIIASVAMAMTVAFFVWKFVLPLIKRSPAYVW